MTTNTGGLCTKCKKFPTLPGKSRRCRACRNAYMRGYWKREKPRAIRKARYDAQPIEKKRAYHLMRAHGITLEQFYDLARIQEGKCAICAKTETDGKVRAGGYTWLHVDHDHETNKIRGLLCNNCNCGVGYFGDGSVQTAIAFVKYLVSYEPDKATPWNGTRRTDNRGNGWHPRT